MVDKNNNSLHSRIEGSLLPWGQDMSPRTNAILEIRTIIKTEVAVSSAGC